MRVVLVDRLLADSAAPILADAAVITNGGKIVYAGPRSDMPATPRSAAVVELGDRTLMPGLFDCHLHLCMDPSDESTTANDERLSDVGLIRRRMLMNATRLLDAGITTARDLGSPKTLGTEVRDALAASNEPAPRLLVANAPITVPRGHAWAMGGEAQGVEGVRAQVRAHVDAGVDVIKVMTTGGFMTAGTGPWKARFSLEELQAIVDEAHAHGVPVTTHALGVEGIALAVRAGVDSIEHCGWVTENGSRFDVEVARELIQRGIAVSPTMNAACTADTYFCPWDDREQVISNLRALHEMGAILVAGTDAGIPLVPFERFADCLEIFAEIGASPREVISSATDTAAQVCGVERLTGRVEAGLSADMIAVPGDPTEDVAVLRSPEFVMAQGLVHERRAVDATVGDEQSRERILARLTLGAGRSN